MYRGRAFSEAPTVSTFLAVPGAPMESLSTTPLALASVPALPAEKVTSIRGKSHMNSSTLTESRV